MPRGGKAATMTVALLKISGYIVLGGTMTQNGNQDGAAQVNITDDGAAVIKGETISIREGGAALISGQSVSVREGGALLIAAEELSVREGGGGILLANHAEFNDSTILLALADHIGGNVRVMVDVRAGAVFGLLVGAALVGLKLFRRRG